jgi:hypothetical protein
VSTKDVDEAQQRRTIRIVLGAAGLLVDLLALLVALRRRPAIARSRSAADNCEQTSTHD